MRETRDQNRCAAVNPAVGSGDPVSKTHSRFDSRCGVFVRSARQVLWASRVGDRKVCRPFDRFASPHGSALPSGDGQAEDETRYRRSIAMCTHDAGADARARKTSQHHFLPCNHHQDMLFSVRAGVPVGDALEMASCFLAAAQDIAADAAQAVDGGRMWGAYYLIAMAKAAVDASVDAAIKEGDHA